MNKQGSAGLAIVAVLLSLVILGVFLIHIAQRECNSNRDCPQNAYCGSDHECHSYPDKIVVEKNNFLSAAVVFGSALVLAAYIFKTGKIPFKKEKI